MENITVEDVAIEETVGKRYDLVILTSGYEERSTAFSKLDVTLDYENLYILGFDNLRTTDERITNDKYYYQKYGVEPVIINSDDDQIIYTILNGTYKIRKLADFRILVDYSSMSRVWYAAILNWVRNIKKTSVIEIDFIYARGYYLEEPLFYPIDNTMAIVGCEGLGAGNRDNAVAIFSMGTSGAMAESLLEQLQPDVIYLILPKDIRKGMHTIDSCDEKSINKAIFESSRLVRYLPISSVRENVNIIDQLIFPHLKESQITLVPLGPKPHVLACILVSILHPEVTCIRTSTKRRKPEKIQETGEFYCTKVCFY